MERTLPPAQISPLIKVNIVVPSMGPILNQPKVFLPQVARWGFLFAGIMYGASRYSRLYKREQKRLAELERTRPEREAKAKIEHERVIKEQLDELTKQLGSQF